MPLNSEPDPPLDAVRQLVIENKNPSVAQIQRHFKLGYNHASGLLAALEGEIVTAVDKSGWRSMMSLGEKELRRSKVKLAIVDVETTGLDPEENELIGLSVVCVDVDRVTGEFLEVLGSYSGQREPTQPMPPDVEQITGILATDLEGTRLDLARINALLEGCELVLAHNAAFDRAFLAPHVPVIERFKWACSLRDIDWFGIEQQSKASIDHLLSLYNLNESNGTPADDCRALIQILGRPLPVSCHTGFAALLASANMPQYRYVVPDQGADSRSALMELGFSFDPEANAWSAIAGGAFAQRLEAALVDMAVFDGRFERFSVELV
jgi:DNA polymerase-3 subunit epsilon